VGLIHFKSNETIFGASRAEVPAGYIFWLSAWC
jgi:hypothetical protein